MKNRNSGLGGLPLAALALVCGAASAAPIDPALTAQIRADGVADVLIVLPKQVSPALAPLDASVDYKLYRRARVDALRRRADDQQANLRAWLDERGIEYRAYWIADMVWARVSAGDLAALSRRTDIERLAANPRIAARLPQASARQGLPQQIQAVAWGVAKINAPAVWAAGFDGQGVVIAGEDTGYEWDHPALKAQYRGWDGSGADHNYNWHDAIHDSSGGWCGASSPMPCDDHGHGTHTAGSFAGGDGDGQRIGVAPGSKWIGCRNMGSGVGTPATYIECMQWMLAPTDLAGANPRPDLAPDIINNSWTCTPDEGCTVGDEIADVVNQLVDAGIFFIAAAANDGPSCGTISNAPAIYDASFVVGMTDISDRLNSMSSRGPVAGVGRIRPDASAPGVDITSSVPGGGYAEMTGTSMAAPHVAGVAALLMSVNPSLKGHPAQVAQLLRSTAVTSGVTDPSNTGCGGLTMANWPNYQAGYGRIDAYAAAVVAGLGGSIFKDGFDDASGP